MRYFYENYVFIIKLFQKSKKNYYLSKLSIAIKRGEEAYTLFLLFLYIKILFKIRMDNTVLNVDFNRASADRGLITRKSDI